MHKLLQRQLKRAFGASGAFPEGLEPLLAMVDEAYRQSDSERELQERALDLTCQELLEGNRALQQERQEFLQLIEGMPHLVAICREGRLLYINPAGVRLLGSTSAKEVMAKAVSELIHPDDHALVAVQMKAVEQAESRALAAEARFLRPGGDSVTLELQALERVQFEGIEGVLFIGTDVSERKKMQERLMIADRMASVGSLAAGVAHEINNPLSYVVANLAHLEAGAGKIFSEEELADRACALREAREGAERVRTIVRDLKAFSRTSEEKGSSIDVRRTLESSTKLAWNEVRHRARLVREYGEVEPVLANEGQLGQVFLNLLINAAQALPDGQAGQHEIHAKTYMRDKKVVVEVSDTGPGIPAHVLPRIFDPFFTTKPVGAGTGLGLSICHGIVTSVGGVIEVDSVIGRGSSFRVVLPADLEAEVISLPAPKVARSSRRLEVLVVDDEPSVGSALCRLLGAQHQVAHEPNASGALRRLSAGERFDVILCDLMMPEITGMDLFARISAEWPDQAEHVVFCSAGAFTPGARAFLESTPNPFLEKPFDFCALRNLLESVAEQLDHQRETA